MLSETSSIQVAAGSTAAGTSTVDVAVAMDGYDEILVMVEYAVQAADNFLRLSKRAGASAPWETLEGSKVLPTGDGNLVGINVALWRGTHCRIECLRGTATALGPVIVQRANARIQPAPHGATVDLVQLVQPPVGTP